MENVLVSVNVVKLSFDSYKSLHERGLLEYFTIVFYGPFSGNSVYRYLGTDDSFKGLHYNDLLIFSQL